MNIVSNQCRNRTTSIQKKNEKETVSNKPFGLDWAVLYLIGRKVLKLSEDEFWNMTLRSLYLLAGRNSESNRTDEKEKVEHDGKIEDLIALQNEFENQF